MATIKIKKTESAAPSTLPYAELGVASNILYYGNSSNQPVRIANYSDLGNYATAAHIQAINKGGTGATTAAAARTALGLGTAATTDSSDYATAAHIQAINKGGTGATTAAAALTALGAYPASNPSGYTNSSGVTSVTGTGAIASSGGNTPQISHLDTAGHKHIPTAGASGQILRYSASGTATWYTPPWTTNTGTVTSVTGTTNQISVTNGTSTPVLSIPSDFRAPGTILSSSTLTVGTGTAS